MYYLYFQKPFSFFFQRSISSNSPSERNRSPEAKKLKKEDSEGERSDADLVVDDDNMGDSKGNNGMTMTNNNGSNGNRSPRENGTTGSTGDGGSKKDPLSPSSARSTPASSQGKKDEAKTGGGGGSPGAGKILPPVSKAALGALGKRICSDTTRYTKRTRNNIRVYIVKMSLFCYGILVFVFEKLCLESGFSLDQTCMRYKL